MNVINDVKSETLSPAFLGFLKIWQSNPKTGESKLLVDKKNLILYTGSDILADTLAGKPNSAISHLYVSYTNDPAFDIENNPIAKSSSTFVTSAAPGLERNYIRVPLTFPATFTQEENYDHNIAIFTVFMSNPSALRANTDIALTDGSSKFFEAGLVSAYNPAGTPTSHASDRVFSRVNFTPITYDDAFNLTISWGVKFQS